MAAAAAAAAAISGVSNAPMMEHARALWSSYAKPAPSIFGYMSQSIMGDAARYVYPSKDNRVALLTFLIERTPFKKIERIGGTRFMHVGTTIRWSDDSYDTINHLKEALTDYTASREPPLTYDEWKEVLSAIIDWTTLYNPKASPEEKALARAKISSTPLFGESAGAEAGGGAGAGAGAGAALAPPIVATAPPAEPLRLDLPIPSPEVLERIRRQILTPPERARLQREQEGQQRTSTLVATAPPPNANEDPTNPTKVATARHPNTTEDPTNSNKRGGARRRRRATRRHRRACRNKSRRAK